MPEIDGLDSTGLDALLVVRDGRTLHESYSPKYSATKKHILNSVTKTVVSLLVGIAVDRGLLSEDDLALAHLPEYGSLDVDERRSRITIEHLLSMQSGIDWPQFGKANVSNRMTISWDWVKFILRRPMAAEPGTVANYSNGDSHLLSAILQRVTGMKAKEFARDVLFGPLGITDVRWLGDKRGRSMGCAGLYLRPADLVKIGTMCLNRGDGIVSERWLDKSWTGRGQIGTSGGPAEYGYFWWIYPERGLYEAWGGAGQRLAVFPGDRAIVVMTARRPEDVPRSPVAARIYDAIGLTAAG